jgi:predicted membrane-bound spermidine synthase/Tfp pilus assembly protein PilF
VAHSVLVCFFISGAAGLVYQVAWGKALGLIFGHTVYAITVVLAVFMGGLGGGSAWLGSWSERQARNPVAVYAWLEILVAVTGAISLAGLACVRAGYLTAAHAVGDAGVVLLLLRVVGAAVVLIVPTFLMGGTFPVLVAGLTQKSAELGQRVAQLYWVNTLGAVAGALISGFLLLPWMGLRLTIGCAALMNIIAACVAWRLSNSFASAAIDSNTSSNTLARPTEPPNPVDKSSSQPIVIMALGVAGAASFGYEVAWTRLLATSIGSSTYAFTLMLATFLGGIVFGSAIFQRLCAGRGNLSLATLAWTQTGIGAAAVCSLFFFRWIPNLIPPILRLTHETFAGLVLAQVVTSALVMLPMAVLFGFSFPLALVLLGGNAEHSGAQASEVGRGYAANTIGAILGALLAGFWLIPWLGSFRTIAVIAGVNLVLAMALNLRDKPVRMAVLLTGGVVFACAIAMIGNSAIYQRSLLTLSAALYGNSYQGHLTLEEIAATSDVVYAEEGLNASVAALRSDDYVGLRINGKVDASSGDARTQLLLGHLGAAFHPMPKRVLIIGFGSGMTAAAVARYPGVERIDCVEIEPAVIHAASYFERLNNRILEDTRLNLIFDDARSFLPASRENYDLIISEPSNPWIAGIATLFTDEFYSAVRRRLAPGGMFVQWVQSYSLAPADLQMIVATLAPHFSEVTLWHAEGPDFLLLARTVNAPLRFEHLQSAWNNAGLRKDFEAMQVHRPEGVVAYFLLDDAGVRKLAEGGAKNTDDRTLLEYHAPRTLLARGLSEANRQMISPLRTAALPSNLESTARLVASEAGALTALDLQDEEDARRFLKTLDGEPESAARRIAEGRMELLQNSFSGAKSSFAEALKLDPESAEAAHWLALAEHRAGEESEARELLDVWINRRPKSLPLLTDKMDFAVDRQDFGVALLAQLNRMSIMADSVAAEYCRLGAIRMKLGDFAAAKTALERGIAKDGYSYACHLARGEIYRQERNYAEARKEFELVLRYFPDADPTTYRSLAGVDVLVGDRNAARETLRKGLRVFPEDAGLRAAVSGK